MSHQIATRAGIYSFAFTGDRAAIWHGHGQQMADGASLDEWLRASGMNFEVLAAPVEYAIGDCNDLHRMPDRQVLYRSDDATALAVVSDSFKVVQPRQLEEFIFSLFESVNLKPDTAGVLFDGRRFFATAKIDGDLDVGGGDTINGHILAATAVDGTMATEIRNVATRVVCNNTLTVAMNEKGKRGFKVSHRSVVDFEVARKALGLAVQGAESEFARLLGQATRLSQFTMTRDRADGFVTSLLSGASTDAKVQAQVKESMGYRKILSLFGGDAIGADMDTARGTAWGLLNAVTEYADHHVRARSDAHRMDSALFGPGDALKADAFQQLVQLTA
jgi:phage/plasmid-like protein (TIGR03299 family)